MRKEVTLQEIANLTRATLRGNPQYIIHGVADLERASEKDVSFLTNSRYSGAMVSSKAGAIFLAPATEKIPDIGNFLFVDDPSAAMQILIDYFFDKESIVTGFEGIHPTAIIHSSAKLGAHLTIGPHAVIERNAVIGDHTSIGAGTFIGVATNIGSHCQIYPNVTIRENCHLGNRVILQPGCVIGSCGFGYITDKKGQHVKLEQVGQVIIEDDVEIGANTTIDRSRLHATVIGRGTKIDNLVQVAHGVKTGQGCLLVSQVGIAGSTKLGKYVVLGGQVGVAGHLEIGDGAMVAAGSGVSKSLKPHQKYNGIPATPIEEYNRNAVYLRNIETYIKKTQKLEKELEDLKKKGL